MVSSDVLVIGGGVSGILAAITSARKGEDTVILEKADTLGKKLLATGNGRCNLMNLAEPIFYGNPEFARTVLGMAPVQELTDFWHSIGLFLRFDPDGRGYPCTFQASTVLDVLKTELRRNKVRIYLSRRAKALIKNRDNTFCIEDQSGEKFTARRVIVSTGGMAQPRLGGNDDAWEWLRKIGHSFIPPVPALTPLITDKKSISGLAGIRVKCQITLFAEGAEIHRERGELLFTENGISGICVMQCARFVRGEHCEARICLFPDLFDEQSLFCELRKRQLRNPDGPPTELLQGLCAPHISYAVCKQAGLSVKEENTGDLTELQLRQIVTTALNYRVQILRREGFERAQVMAGGLDCREINPSNMESYLSPGLHVTGELLDVDGDCGGFNLMFACMSGLRAGDNQEERSVYVKR